MGRTGGRRLLAAVGETRRQQLLAATSAVLGGVVVVSAAADQLRWAAAGTGLLLVVVLLVLLDIRRRLGSIADRVKANTLDLARLRSGQHANGKFAADARFDAMTRRVITAIESARLEAADRHAETVKALEHSRSTVKTPEVNA